MTPRTTRPWLGLLGGALCCSVWSASANSLTTDQLFESQCEQLEQELSANYDRQRQGFRLSQEQAIERAAASLQQLLDDACQSPRVDAEPQDPQQQFQQVTRQNQRSLAPSARAKVRTDTNRAAGKAQHQDRPKQTAPRADFDHSHSHCVSGSASQQRITLVTLFRGKVDGMAWILPRTTSLF